MKRLTEYFSIAAMFFYISLFLVNCSNDKTPYGQKKGEKFKRCAAVQTNKNEETIINGIKYIQKENILEVSPFNKSQLIVGAFSGLVENTEENRDNINRLFKIFKQNHVDFVVGAGDICVNKADCVEILSFLGKSGFPLLLIPGATESWRSWLYAFDKVRNNHKNIINLAEIRVVLMGDFYFVTLPGYFEPFYLYHKNDGCSYTKQDLSLIERHWKKYNSDKTGILLTSSPPRGNGSESIDWARGGINIGDIDLKKVINKLDIHFGIFGHVYEAGGRGVDFKNKTVVKQDTLSQYLFVNPGAVESTPYELTDGNISTGMGIIMTITSDGAKYKTIYIKHVEVN